MNDTPLSTAKTKNDLPPLSLQACMACEGTTLPCRNKSLNILKLHMEFFCS